MSSAGRPLILIAAAVTLAGRQLAAAEDVQFNRDIRPILSDNCFACHGPSRPSRKADLRLDQREAALAASVLSPGAPDDSELLRRINSTDPEEVMPPPETKRFLTTKQKNLLRQWISAGAEYQPHWAFLAVPAQVSVPTPADSSGWIHTAIDAFVLERLRRDQLSPAAPATREQWLRRVTFDLTGLPPTLDELDAFAADQSEQAFEAVIDRLFQSPAYGERMAVGWLDTARYADTFGYQADRDMHMSPWRDWVIRAFQNNLSYRDFIVWQIAGDMLDQPTRDQQLATAFNRLHRQTNEGGSIEEEFRIEYVADRVRTMGSAFLGLTLECARCHDHKYDPITQREYYSLTAIFNNIDEHGLYSHFTETAPTPTLLLFEGDQETRHQQLLAQVAEAEAGVSAARDALRSGLPALPAADVAVPAPIANFNFEDLQPAGDYKSVPGHSGTAIEFGGDDAFICTGVPEFNRTSSFSFSLWTYPTEHQPRQILIHQSRAAEDSAFRGVSLTLDSGVPELSLVHFWPGNAIRVRAAANLPLNEWNHLTATYDGSSRASGVRIYLNGKSVPITVVRDKLTRDFIHRAEWGDSEAGQIPLALGARFRDVGFRAGRIDDLQIFDRELTPRQAAVAAGIQPPTDSDSLLADACLSDAGVQTLVSQLHALRVQENDLIGQVRQIMTMREMPERRTTYLLARGGYDARTEPVEPATPAGIFPMPAELPRNRLGFAQWLVDDRNPLAARVAVNRLWSIFFGRGLVATPQDFGSQGLPPSHPELLDWLARDFMDHGWDVQRLCRVIALSSTYRQSSTPASPDLFNIDPDNIRLARGPRQRLSGEQLRDNVLAVSGLLRNRVGGPSVFPYQPAGLWEEAGTGKSYSQSHGDDLYRRSLYTFWRRTSPPPTMTTFDAPTREYCVVERERTATPLQALTLFNDPQFVEAARVLAEHLLTAQSDDRSRLTTAFRLLTSRRPSVDEQAVLEQMLARQRSFYADRKEDAAQYVSMGESPRNEQLDVTEHAALTAVIQALLNFDECTTQR